MTPQPITYRKGEPKDFTAVSAMDEEVFGLHHSYPAFVLRQFDDLGFALLLAESEQGEIAGYVQCGVHSIDTNVGWVLALAVHPDFRGQGIAVKLMELCEREYFQGLVERVTLTVDPNNTVAVHLYEKLGYQRTEYYPDYFGPGEDRVRMVKELPRN